MDFSARKIFTVANFVSASRIVMVPFIGWLLFIDSVPARLAAGLLLALAIFTDFLDGWLARLLDQVSDLGKIIDPLADKLFVILLVVELILLRDFPLWLALVIIGKDVLIVGAGALVIGRKRVVMQSNVIGKYAFGFQAGLVVCYFLEFSFGEWLFTIGSLVLIAASLVSYGKALLFVVRSPEEEVVVPQPPQIVPTWARRAAVVLLLVVTLPQMFYWALENNEIDLNPIDPPALPPQEARALAERFAPIFVFGADDLSQPLALEDYLQYAEARQGNRYFLALLDSPLAGAPLGPFTFPNPENDEAYLVLPNGTPFDSGAAAALSPPRVYVHACSVAEGGRSWTVIQYWLFFAVEEVPIRRTGDWQMAAVYLDEQGAPLHLALTQGWYGSVTEWIDVELSGDRPIVYVSPGCHSLYPRAGDYRICLDEERVFSIALRRIEGGGGFRAQDDYELTILTGEEPWLAWRGRWGGPLPGGDRGPRYWNPKRPDLAPWSHPVEFLRFYSQ